MHKFDVEFGIDDLPADVVKEILLRALYFYMEEHLVEVHPEVKKLTDYDWDLKIDGKSC